MASTFAAMSSLGSLAVSSNIGVDKKLATSSKKLSSSTSISSSCCRICCKKPMHHVIHLTDF